MVLELQSKRLVKKLKKIDYPKNQLLLLLNDLETAYNKYYDLQCLLSLNAATQLIVE